MKRNKKLFFPTLFGESYATRRLSFGALLTVVLLAVLIALNALLGRLPMHLSSPDVTGSETFRLSGAAKDWLARLDEEITLYLVCAGGEAAADPDIYAFLQQVASASRHIDVKVIDAQKNAAALSLYGAKDVADQSVIVTSAKRHRVISNTELYYYYYPYSSGGGTTLSAEEYRYMLEYWAATDATGSYVTQLVSGVVAYFDGGSRVINAINYVLADHVATAYVVGSNGVYPDAVFYRKLSNAGYDTRSVASLSDFPSDCDVLVLYAPVNDIFEEEARLLSEYLANGGKLFLMSCPVETPQRLGEVLAAYGMRYVDSTALVCDANPNSMTNEGSPYLFYAQIQSQNQATRDFAESFVVYSAHAIAVEEVEGVTVTPWLYTTQAGYTDDMNDKTPISEKGVQTVGVTAQKGETKIVWLSCAQSMTEAVDTSYAQGGNTLLARYAMNWLTGTDVTPVEISPTVINTEVLSVSYNAFIIWSVIMVLLIPAGAIAVGAVIRYTRKKR